MKLRVSCPAVLAALLVVALALAAAPVAVTKVMGTPIAAITIDIYSDFQCPKCKYLHETWMPLLIKDYVQTGKAHLIQHEFPLPQHPYAKIAASYACAAEHVGKYGEVSDILFKKQEEWEKDGKVDQTACSVLTASEAAKVRALAKDPAIAAEIQKDMEQGMKLPLTETPTLIVTHKGKHYQANVKADYKYFALLLDGLH